MCLRHKKIHWDTQYCTVRFFYSQNKAPSACLLHFLLDIMVSGFSLWIYTSLNSRTKRLLVNQPEKSSAGSLLKLLASIATCKICKSRHHLSLFSPQKSGSVWMRQWGRKRCERGEEVMGECIFSLALEEQWVWKETSLIGMNCFSDN